MTDDHRPDRASGETDAVDDALVDAASAVVDGIATDVERELVESDPRGHALVERFRALADAVADVDSTEEAVREEHLAVALAAYGTVGAVQPSPTSVRSATSRWRRPPMRRALAAAAAVLAVGVLGVVVANLDGSTDDDASTADMETAAATAAPDDADDALTMMADDAPETAADLFDADSSDPMDGGRIESDDADVADQAEPSDDEDAEPDDGAIPDDAPAAVVPILAGPDELAELGASALRASEDEQTSGPLDPDTDPPPTADVLDPAIEACLPEGALPIGPVVYDGEPAFAMLTVGAISGIWDTVVAIDAADCSIVATVPLPDSD